MMTTTSTTTRSGPRGRPVLGAIAGLLFGFFVALDLVLLGTIPLSSLLLVVLPILGLVGGTALGRWSPIGR